MVKYRIIFSMENLFLADAHCDTISRIHENREQLAENTGHLDIKRCQAGNVRMQFFAVWVSPFCKTPFKSACDMIETYHEQTAKNLNSISKFRSKWDYDETKLNAVLTLEGGHVLEGKLENLEEFYKMGVRLLTLTWNGENELGHGAFPISSEQLAISNCGAFRKRNVFKNIRKDFFLESKKDFASAKSRAAARRIFQCAQRVHRPARDFYF